ncbi:NAD(P)-dependent oxidoreductase [Sphingomonas oligophenolica]|uniref:NAD(P)-dependent oxidoreductase n=1 Tax=Sphingomonas oligophenolica TaxID=301154 RepID=A0ABU9Y674_9SPHN
MNSVVVTGGSGKVGRAVIRDLLDRGYRVMNVDVAPPPEPLCHFMKADLTDFGQAVEAITMAAGTVDRRRTPLGTTTGVIHMAGIPTSSIAPDTVTFQNNIMSTYNIFSAATRAGISRVVWASSETIYGVPMTRATPAYVPIDEDHPQVPETGYALAKMLCETMAEEMHRWNPHTSFMGLRISHVFDPAEYGTIPDYWGNQSLKKWDLWGWVDSRDAAQACRLALESDLTGAQVFTIAAADTAMREPNRTLLADAFPDTPIKDGLGDFETLIGIEKARRMLGYAPQHTWRT